MRVILTDRDGGTVAVGGPHADDSVGQPGQNVPSCHHHRHLRQREGRKKNKGEDKGRESREGKEWAEEKLGEEGEEG